MAKERNIKNKKIKRLKKAHIWPSVLFLVLSIVLVIVLAGFFAGLLINYSVGDRVTVAYDNAKSISQMFYRGQSPEEEERVLSYLEESGEFADAVYIVDGDDVRGYGGATYSDMSGELTVGDLELCSFRLDKDVENVLFNEEGTFDVSVVIRDSLHNPNVKGEQTTDNHVGGMSVFHDRTVLYEAPFWFEMELPDSRLLLTKYTIRIYRGILILALFVAGVAGAVMALPCVFLFFNVVGNVLNQHRMTQLIYTDTTTGGNGWLYFEHYVEKQLYKKRASGQTFAIVDVCLMKYRNYCICYGIDAGEILLQKIDKSLSSMRSKKEICAHQTKADFALLLDCESREQCVSRVEEMLNKLPELLGNRSLVFHAGIYFVDTGRAQDSIKDLQRKDIDVAEYYSRASLTRAAQLDDSQTAVSVFDEKLLEEKLWESHVEDKMQSALDNEEFQVYIQPKYNPVTEKLAGAEALVRWINEEDGFVPPGRFIPIFESNGFIVKLDDYMISHVAALQAEWISQGKNVVPISVNVSRAHFANPDLAQHICGLVDKYKVPHNLIEIELTESAFFDDKDALLHTVGELKHMGFDVSMDDFGAGYSSLNSLKDLPLDVLKLDADFFRGKNDTGRGEIVVSQAIRLAKKLNMRIVAEGIEKKEQVEFLASKECDMIQGYYYAKPMPANEYEQRL